MTTKNVYVGKRYVPKIIGDWDNTKNTSYESLSIVTYGGDSFTSKQDVPTGIDITNTLFWAETGIYNAQIQLYKNDVDNYKNTSNIEINKINALINNNVVVIKKDELIADDSDYIQAFLENSGDYVLVGNFNISKTLKLKDNTRLRFKKGSTLTLKPNSNCYMITNYDLNNGNKNITIQNFNINGNGDTQNRWFGENAKVGYNGFGMMFNKVYDLKILDGYIENTNAWAIAGFSCDTCQFKQIRFMQKPTKLKNTDGITGQFSNTVFENISGFTGDDMIGLSTYSGALGGGSNNMPDFPIKNVVIRNIYPEKNVTMITPQAIGLYASNNVPIDNIVIENVKGYTGRMLINILNYWEDKPNGIFNNIFVSNVERLNDFDDILAEKLPVINIGTGRYNNITIKNIFNKSSNLLCPHMIQINTNADIEYLYCDNLKYINNHPTLTTGVVVLEGENVNVRNVYVSNSEIVNVAGRNTDSVFYKIGVNNHQTIVNANNLIAPKCAIDSSFTTSTLSVNAPNVKTDITKLYPREGDCVISQYDSIQKTFSHGHWDYSSFPITLTNSWVAYDNVSYSEPLVYKISNKTFLQGTIKLGISTNGTKIGTIPIEFAPQSDYIFPVSTAGGIGNIKVNRLGELSITIADLPNNTIVVLNNISFPILYSLVLNGFPL